MTYKQCEYSAIAALALSFIIPTFVVPFNFISNHVGTIIIIMGVINLAIMSKDLNPIKIDILRISGPQRRKLLDDLDEGKTIVGNVERTLVSFMIINLVIMVLPKTVLNILDNMHIASGFYYLTVTYLVIGVAYIVWRDLYWEKIMSEQVEDEPIEEDKPFAEKEFMEEIRAYSQSK